MDWFIISYKYYYKLFRERQISVIFSLIERKNKFILHQLLKESIKITFTAI